MAIVKPIKVRVGNLAGLRAVLDYIKEDRKTQNGALVYCKDLLKGKEYQQMVITKRAFHKDTGRQYAHFVQSFDPRDNVSPELAYKIGQEFIKRYEPFQGFQVMMAVHTNEPHMHIHYIVSSVSHENGCKWQSSPEDLKRMRSLSDELCLEHGLSVIEHGRKGHRSYGEYSQTASWKRQLAQDIANNLAISHSRADFIHRMENIGIDADVGEKSALFTIPAGVYGLQSERKCSNWKLISYGDFTTENMRNTWNCNAGLARIGGSDMQLLQEVLLELGQLHCPDTPDRYQDMYFRDIPFDGMTKQEIEIALSRKALDSMLEKARQAHEKAKAESRQAGLLLATIADTLAEVLRWQEEQRQNAPNHDDYTEYEEENEYEL
ncbi:relaxase/mobilization nuclease domain-containing protein [Cellulosilyticum lentocellum]|uniref:Relaxase/mobilization nuclease family protein n=1 Tax=Cellulosilyticum lentocellum (strain ATCC 49066 / DSM 5427 / NCIMB 11756 / RHM5) TaxID=642492 RepID=F2JPB9_CELLD|nr:relaxase/mobilization nuclease domain-containing protein [Cellulosilyticum lentocellum]ADZ84858.1 Relaxase/mobilization nuclease family protein [Cellulosilyticum lentocellum DSM 5427]